MTEALRAKGVALDAASLIALRQLAIKTRAAPTLAALPGGLATRRKGQGLEVADTREYVQGDDYRRLDFGTTARTGILHVRQFQEERDRVSLLIADFRPAMLWGIRRAFRSVAAAEALAIFGWNVVEHGGRVALLVVLGDDILVVPARGRTRGMLDVIGGLVEAHDRALRLQIAKSPETQSLVGALQRVERLVPAGSEVVIASGFDKPGEGFEDRINEIGRRRAPRLIHVTDAFASSLPKGRYPVRLSDGTRHNIRRRMPHSDPGATEEPIAGRPAMAMDAGAPVEAFAAGLLESFSQVRPS